MIDEGAIKFDCTWAKGPEIPDDEIADLIEWRNRLQIAGLIGHDEEHDVGFGNISRRESGARAFVISGTQTGHVAVASGRHFTRVVDYDIGANRVACRGPLRASSESLTHAAVYELDPDWRAVVHVHDQRLWQSLVGEIPTTGADVPYGTPEMAAELRSLYREARLCETRVAAMAGHAGGLIGLGGSVQEAATRILSLRAA